MPRQLILLVASDDQRLQIWHTHVRRAGHRPLPAPSIRRALMLVHKVRPTLVLADVDLSDGPVHTLLHEIRAIPKLEHVRVVILGVPQEHEHIQRDPHAHVRQLETDEAIREVLEEFLGAA